jgi:anti-sigma B factor antagonist
MASSSLLRQKLGEACDGGEVVVVDLAAVTFLDSTGLGVLVGAKKRARAAGGRIVVAGAGPNVFRVFALTGLVPVFDVQPEGTPWPWPEIRQPPDQRVGA